MWEADLGDIFVRLVCFELVQKKISGSESVRRSVCRPSECSDGFVAGDLENSILDHDEEK